MLVIACVLLGLLAGETLDRLVVGFYAWKYLDIGQWADYSRHADLGNGMFVYPVEAILSTILLIIASVFLFKIRAEIKPDTFWEIHLATVFSVIGLLLTFSAGPFMLSIRHISERGLLQNAFDNFYFWSTFRGIAHITSFIFLVIGISKQFHISGKRALQ